MKFKSYVFIGISILLLVAFISSKLQLNTPQSDSKIIQRADFEFTYCEEYELPYKFYILFASIVADRISFSF